MSERSDAPTAEEGRVIQVPVDLVDFESRLAAIERRLAAFEAREERLLEVVEAVKKLTDAVGPLVKPGREPPAPPVQRNKPGWPLPVPQPSLAGPVAPERIALAHSRLRETLFAPSSPEPASAPPASDPSASAKPTTAPPPLAPSPSPEPATAPPPGRDSWLLRAVKRMVKNDPQAAGNLLAALPPAHGLARVAQVPELPGPPEGLVSVLVVGRLRRRIRWEKARLPCPPKAVYELAPLVRMRATPAQLHAAAVQLDPPLAFSLAAHAIDPAWTAGHRFTISHRGPGRVTYFTVFDRAVPAVATEPPSAPVATTICCLDEDLVPVLCGRPPAGVTILGAVAPLELVQRWFARASRAAASPA